MAYQIPDQYPSLVREDDEMGVNAPMIHQQIISRLHVELGVLYYHQKRIQVEPLPQTMVGEESSRYDGLTTPDLILYDQSTEQTAVIIEVCQTRGLKNDLKKVITLIDEDVYGIREGFVHNYKTGDWFRYRRGDAGLTEKTAHSEVLGLNLGKLLRDDER